MLGLNCSLQLLKKSIYLKTLLTSEIIWGSFFIILFYFILFYFVEVPGRNKISKDFKPKIF